MVFIVVPARNEEHSVGRVIRGLFEHGFSNVVVVDDGSSDNTVREAKAAGAVVLSHGLNRGQGAALQTGDEYAYRHGADAVVHFDADGQFNPGDIQPALDKMEREHLAAVLGSRFLDSRSRIPWFKKHILLPVSRWIHFVFTGVLLTDVHNGFRVLSRLALEKIRITHDGMAHNTEILQQLRHFGLPFAEVPVEVIYHTYGQGIGGGVQIVGDLLLERFTKK